MKVKKFQIMFLLLLKFWLNVCLAELNGILKLILHIWMEIKEFFMYFMM